MMNARDAVGQSGRIVVSVRPNQAVRVVEICVDDEGEGVPESLRGQIFDPFFTTKSPGDGIGLGLAVVHSLVVGQWGGDIDVTDAPAGGARFVLTLPLREREPEPSDERPRPAVTELRSVLVVDDEPAVRAATARLLKLLGASPSRPAARWRRGSGFGPARRTSSCSTS